MTVHKPVGLGNSIAISAATATSSNALSVQTKALRVVAVSAGTFIGIGTNPTASLTDYYVAANTSAVLALSPASQKVSGITTGTTTIIDFPAGTGSPFVVGDYVSLTSIGQSYYNFIHQPVTAVDVSSGYNGYYSTRISISTSTSGILTAFTATDGDLRKSIKISTYGTGVGALYYQQVQIAGDA
jgi:hypothetical protein